MIDRTIKIITPFSTPVKTCVMGNEAIVRAAVEAGVDGVFSYPGTPSTEISQIFSLIHNFQTDSAQKIKYPELVKDPVYFEYSINEKIALEKAIAYSIGHRSAMCVMKNVGMNVASDPLMSVTYQTICAPLVIIVCDDPGCHSSSNEQDSRYWGPMASVPVFNPSSPEQAYQMTKQAFELSDKLKLPVIVRTTTRVSHSKGVVSYGNFKHILHNASFERLPEHINIPARTSAAHSRLIEKLNSEITRSFHNKNIRHISGNNSADLAVISSGVSFEYVNEILPKNKFKKLIDVMDIGLINPFPVDEVLAFLKKGYKKILILEELDPYIENAVRTIAQKNEIDSEIVGKGFSLLNPAGEFSIDLLNTVLDAFIEEKHTPVNVPLQNTPFFTGNLPPRPPALCAGCPHRATYYLLKLAIPRDQSELIMCGDIGCFGLGALPPLKMIDTVNHMGMSISMAQGLYQSFSDSEKSKKVVALLGDGTFFHSGLTSIVNAIYTRANILVIIFDNRTIGMTGHQDHPGASKLPKYHEIDIPPMLKGMGIEVVETIDPYNIRQSYPQVEKAMSHQGVSVLVSKAPCIFLPEYKDGHLVKKEVRVDSSKCNTCANHDDTSLACSRCYSPLSNLSRAKSRLLADYSIAGEEQLCPANICNHGFYNSIVEGRHKDALEIVRDKMLFARTCGDICHRPCELFSDEKEIVPIKQLKKFVAGFKENFEDFSNPISRRKNAGIKNKKIAVIGSGPAGLSVSYDLLQQGYSVTIFEKESKPGGMITWAIPAFRMDKSGFEFEALQLKDMGAEFRFNTAVGRDVSTEQLNTDFDAVILAVGMQKSKSLEMIENTINESDKLDAIRFLKLFNENNIQFSTNSRVLVVGGGNSAIDAARSAFKLNAGEVTITCPESENEMPAFKDEIQHSKNEGIKLKDQTVISKITMQKDGSYTAELKNSVTKESVESLVFDFIVTAIGQQGEFILPSKCEVELDERCRVTRSQFEVNGKNWFAAGDIAAGNHMSLIGAIASGKKAAIEVRKVLENYLFDYEGDKALKRLNTQITNIIRPENVVIGKEFFENHALSQSCQKCNHCIDNFGCPAMIKVNDKIEVDMSRCTLCGLCVDVCPNNAITIETIQTT